MRTDWFRTLHESTTDAMRARMGRQALACILIPACQAAAQRSVSRVPVAGVLGQEFTHISSIRELSDGSVLVADDREFRLVHADWVTSTVKSVGRAGRGPSEFQSLGRMVPLGGDSSLIADGVLRRWLILDGPRVVATLPPDYPLTTALGLELSGGDRQGRVLAVRARLGSPLSSSPWLADSTVAIIGDFWSSRVSELDRLRGAEAMPQEIRLPRFGARTFVVNPLRIEEQALLHPDGWIAFARTLPYRVDWLAPDGRMTRGQALPNQPSRLDEHGKRAAMVSELGKDFSDLSSNALSDWPEFSPAFPRNALFAAPDGNLVIRRLDSTGSEGLTYDVIDRRCRLSHTLRLRPNERIVGFGRGSIYIAVVDSDHLERLRRDPWPSR